MRNWLKLLFAALLLNPLYTAAADSENGKALHNANCSRCHGSDIYTRPGRMVNSLQELDKRVHQCVQMAELPWFDEEIKDVVEYLNVYFYNFGMK